MDGTHRLTFLLPPTMLLRVHEGRHHPCVQGVLLTVRDSLVVLEGGSREQVFDQTKRFFRVNAKQLPPFTVAAALETQQRRGPPARDAWTIAINSDVTLTPAAIVDIARPEPQFTILGAG